MIWVMEEENDQYSWVGFCLGGLFHFCGVWFIFLREGVRGSKYSILCNSWEQTEIRNLIAIVMPLQTSGFIDLRDSNLSLI